jgi:hypothetical protein
MREKWWYPSWRELLFGIAAGFASNELWLRRNLRRFVEAVEQGDMDAAEKFADRAYLTNFLLWLRHRMEGENAEDDGSAEP